MVLPGNFSSGFSAFGGAVFSENWVASAVVFSEKSNAPVVSFFKSAASKTGAVPKFPGRAKPSAGGFSKFLELEKPRSFSAVFFSKFGWAKTPGLFSVKFFGKTAGADCATGDPFLTAAGGATEGAADFKNQKSATAAAAATAAPDSQNASGRRRLRCGR